jgi:hypothetical protein
MKLVFIPLSDFVAFSDHLIEKQSSPKSVSAQSVGEAEEGNSGESRLRILHQSLEGMRVILVTIGT